MASSTASVPMESRDEIAAQVLQLHEVIKGARRGC